MAPERSRSRSRFPILFAIAWTLVAAGPIVFLAGWTGSFSYVLLDPEGVHTTATIVLWLVALSPLVGWWLALSGRLDKF